MESGPFEASNEFDESIASFNVSLSVWKGYTTTSDGQNFLSSSLNASNYDVSGEGDFEPIPFDLHTECSLGHYRCVREAVERGTLDLDGKNKGHWTPLMYACYIGHDSIVNLLLDAGVSVNSRNNKWETPLMLAASCGNENIAYYLLQQGAQLEDEDIKGRTAIHHATYSGHQNTVKVLVENGANINSVEPTKKMTPLLEAAKAGHEIVVQYFFQKGADVYAKNCDGHTALTLAMLRGHTNVISIIKKHLDKLEREILAMKNERKANTDMLFKNLTIDRTFAATSPSAIMEGPAAINELIRKMKTAQVYPTSVNPDPGNPETKIASNQEAMTKQQNNNNNKNDERLRYESNDAIKKTLLTKTEARDNSAIKSETNQNATTKIGTTNQNTASKLSTNDNTASKLEANQNIAIIKSRPYQREIGSKTTNQMDVIGVEPDVRTDSIAGRPIEILNDGLNIAPNQSEYNLKQLLTELGLAKYYPIFEEQDVDLSVFLSLNDNDLKEIGINLLGPRKKMTMAIARWLTHKPTTSQANSQSMQMMDPSTSSSMKGGMSDIVFLEERTRLNRRIEELQEFVFRLHQANEQLEQELCREEQLRNMVESYLVRDRKSLAEVYKSMDCNMRTFLLNKESVISNFGQCLNELSQYYSLTSSIGNVGPAIKNNPYPIDEKSEMLKIDSGTFAPINDADSNFTSNNIIGGDGKFKLNNNYDYDKSVPFPSINIVNSGISQFLNLDTTPVFRNCVTTDIESSSVGVDGNNSGGVFPGLYLDARLPMLLVRLRSCYEEVKGLADKMVDTTFEVLNRIKNDN